MIGKLGAAALMSIAGLSGSADAQTAGQTTLTLTCTKGTIPAMPLYMMALIANPQLGSGGISMAPGGLTLGIPDRTAPGGPVAQSWLHAATRAKQPLPTFECQISNNTANVALQVNFPAHVAFEQATGDPASPQVGDISFEGDRTVNAALDPDPRGTFVFYVFSLAPDSFVSVTFPSVARVKSAQAQSDLVPLSVTQGSQILRFSPSDGGVPSPP